MKQWRAVSCRWQQSDTVIWGKHKSGVYFVTVFNFVATKVVKWRRNVVEKSCMHLVASEWLYRRHNKQGGPLCQLLARQLTTYLRRCTVRRLPACLLVYCPKAKWALSSELQPRGLQEILILRGTKQPEAAVITTWRFLGRLHPSLSLHDHVKRSPRREVGKVDRLTP